MGTAVCLLEKYSMFGPLLFQSVDCFRVELVFGTISLVTTLRSILSCEEDHHEVSFVFAGRTPGTCCNKAEE
jgi:hypothetical protein